MNMSLLIGVASFLAVVFAVLGYLHRSIHAAENRRLAEKIRSAEEDGSNQALTQHPQIDLDRCMGCGSCAQACHESGVLALVEGKARLVNASGCVGHGLCEEVCPIGALTVGLGDVSQRTDLPILTEERETSVPGVFIAGELGGIGLIRHAIAQGTEIIETIASRLKARKRTMHIDNPIDVLIVGSGPAGIAAVLKAHELGLKYKIIDQDELGGTVRKYPRNKMTLTQPVTLPIYGKMKRSEYVKEELIEIWEGIFEKNGIEVHSGIKFSGLDPLVDGTLSVNTSAGKIHCCSCVLALGRRGTPRRLGVPGEDSERVLYQLVDAADYTDQGLLVVGGGDSAIEAALALASQPGNRVALSYRRHAFFRLKPRNRERLEAMRESGKIEVLFNSQVQEIESGQALLFINRGENEPAEERIVDAQFVFVFAGGEPPFPLMKKIGVQFGGSDDSADFSSADSIKVAG